MFVVMMILINVFIIYVLGKGEVVQENFVLMVVVVLCVMNEIVVVMIVNVMIVSVMIVNVMIFIVMMCFCGVLFFVFLVMRCW